MSGRTAEDPDNVTEGLKALIRCMHIMAGADKLLTLSEIEVVSEIYAGLLGRDIDDTLVREVFSQMRACDQATALSELQDVSARIGLDMKERIVGAAFIVMMADRKADPRETKRLAESASILEIPQDRYAQLIRDAAK